MCVSKLRGNLAEVLLPSGFWGSYSGNLTWWQAASPSWAPSLTDRQVMHVCMYSHMYVTCAFHGMHVGRSEVNPGCLPQPLSTFVLIESLRECLFGHTCWPMRPWYPGVCIHSSGFTHGDNMHGFYMNSGPCVHIPGIISLACLLLHFKVTAWTRSHHLRSLVL